MPNLAGRGRYLVDPEAHIELRRALRQLKPALSIVGAYHSHPQGPATPSASDLSEAMYPAWTYLIVGFVRGRADVRAFRLAHGRARERPIRWY
jgi:proteasome lid subunit RPN8/RPN11